MDGNDSLEEFELNNIASPDLGLQKHLLVEPKISTVFEPCEENDTTSKEVVAKCNSALRNTESDVENVITVSDQDGIEPLILIGAILPERFPDSTNSGSLAESYHSSRMNIYENSITSLSELVNDVDTKEVNTSMCKPIFLHNNSVQSAVLNNSNSAEFRPSHENYSTSKEVAIRCNSPSLLLTELHSENVTTSLNEDNIQNTILSDKPSESEHDLIIPGSPPECISICENSQTCSNELINDSDGSANQNTNISVCELKFPHNKSSQSALLNDSNFFFNSQSKLLKLLTDDCQSTDQIVKQNITENKNLNDSNMLLVDCPSIDQTLEQIITEDEKLNNSNLSCDSQSELLKLLMENETVKQIINNDKKLRMSVKVVLERMILQPILESAAGNSKQQTQRFDRIGSRPNAGNHNYNQINERSQLRHNAIVAQNDNEEAKKFLMMDSVSSDSEIEIVGEITTNSYIYTSHCAPSSIKIGGEIDKPRPPRLCKHCIHKRHCNVNVNNNAGHVREGRNAGNVQKSNAAGISMTKRSKRKVDELEDENDDPLNLKKCRSSNVQKKDKASNEGNKRVQRNGKNIEEKSKDCEDDDCLILCTKVSSKSIAHKQQCEKKNTLSELDKVEKRIANLSDLSNLNLEMSEKEINYWSPAKKNVHAKKAKKIASKISSVTNVVDMDTQSDAESQEITDNDAFHSKGKEIENLTANELIKRWLLENNCSSSDEDSNTGDDSWGKGAVRATTKSSRKVITITSSSSSDEYIPHPSLRLKKKDKLLRMSLSLPGKNQVKRKPTNSCRSRKKRNAKNTNEDSEDDSMGWTSDEDPFRKWIAQSTTCSSKQGNNAKSFHGKKTSSKYQRKNIYDLLDSETEAAESAENGGQKHVQQQGEMKSSPSKYQRKNIRTLISDDLLDSETKAAKIAEEERRKRVAERRELFRQVRQVESDEPGSSTNVVLEINPTTKEDLVIVHPSLAALLKPHQVNGVKFLWEVVIESLDQLEKNTEQAGCILAHSMGLGKTLQIITFLHTLMTNKYTKNHIKTALIISPYNALLHWVNEFFMWLNADELFLEVYDITEVKDNYLRSVHFKNWQRNGGVLIISYGMLRNLVGVKATNFSGSLKESFNTTLLDPGPDIVICDEGHLLKNETSHTFKTANKIKTLRRIVLTGTPFQNNLEEYHCMMQFVRPRLLGSRKEFRNRFINPIMNGQCSDSTPSDVKLMKRRVHVLNKILKGCIQRFDNTILKPYLPPKHEFVINIRLSEIQSKLYVLYLDIARGKINPKAKTKGTDLFKDYSVLRNIWTHPCLLALSMNKSVECTRSSAKSTTDIINVEEKSNNEEGRKPGRDHQIQSMMQTQPEASFETLVCELDIDSIMNMEAPDDDVKAEDNANSEERDVMGKIDQAMNDEKPVPYIVADVEIYTGQLNACSIAIPNFTMDDVSVGENENQKRLETGREEEDQAKDNEDPITKNSCVASDTETYVVQSDTSSPIDNINTGENTNHERHEIGREEEDQAKDNEDPNTKNCNVAGDAESNLVQLDTSSTMDNFSVRENPNQERHKIGEEKAQAKDNEDPITKNSIVAGETETIVRLDTNFTDSIHTLHQNEQLNNKMKKWWEDYVSEDDATKLELSGKMIVLFDILRECECCGDKVLIFSQNLESLNLIEKIMAFMTNEAQEARNDFSSVWVPGIDYFRMDGSTSVSLRRQYIETFNGETSRARLFMLSTKAGSLGTNLIGANRVIILDASWNPSHDVQAIFRVFRFGQKKPVYVYRLLSQGTMEEKIYERQVTKQSLFCRVIDEQQIERHFTFSDLQELYMYEPDTQPKVSRPATPKDPLLSEILQRNKDWIVSYHEHDSLLQNLPDENLTEEEMKAAVLEYEREKIKPNVSESKPTKFSQKARPQMKLPFVRPDPRQTRLIMPPPLFPYPQAPATYQEYQHMLHQRRHPYVLMNNSPVDLSVANSSFNMRAEYPLMNSVNISVQAPSMAQHLPTGSFTMRAHHVLPSFLESTPSFSNFGLTSFTESFVPESSASLGHNLYEIAPQNVANLLNNCTGFL